MMWPWWCWCDLEDVGVTLTMLMWPWRCWCDLDDVGVTLTMLMWPCWCWCDLDDAGVTWRCWCDLDDVGVTLMLVWPWWCWCDLDDVGVTFIMLVWPWWCWCDLFYVGVTLMILVCFVSFSNTFHSSIIHNFDNSAPIRQRNMIFAAFWSFFQMLNRCKKTNVTHHIKLGIKSHLGCSGIRVMHTNLFLTY
jgi:hypothetical protein